MSNPLHIACPHCNGINRVPAGRLGDDPKCGRCRASLFTGTPVAASAGAFTAQVERGDLPVLVDFWAPWCGPCRMMAPAFEEAARQLEPRVRLVKVNTEEEQALAQRFGIRSIPTLALFKGGREVDRVAGAMDVRNLVAWVRQRL